MRDQKWRILSFFIDFVTFKTPKLKHCIPTGYGTDETHAFYIAGRYDEENDDEANDARGSNAKEQSYF